MCGLIKMCSRSGYQYFLLGLNNDTSSIPAAEDDLVCQEGSGVSPAAVMADSVLSESMTHQQVVESLTKFNQRVSFTNYLKLLNFHITINCHLQFSRKKPLKEIYLPSPQNALPVSKLDLVQLEQQKLWLKLHQQLKSAPESSQLILNSVRILS